MICWDNRETSYFQKMMDDAIKAIKRDRKKPGYDFDSMICAGMSGGAVTPLLAYHFNVPFCIVRRKEDGKHAGSAHSVRKLGTKIMFVDDHVSGGNTFSACQKALDLNDPGNTYLAQYNSYIRAYGVKSGKAQFISHYGEQHLPDPDHVGIQISTVFQYNPGWRSNNAGVRILTVAEQCVCVRFVKKKAAKAVVNASLPARDPYGRFAPKYVWKVS